MPARPSRSSAFIIGTALVIGMAVAAVLAPVAATAAGQLVEISSVSGRKADVTRSAQLQVAEASAHQLVRGYGYGGSGQCVPIVTAPAAKALVIKTAWIDFIALNNVDDYAGLRVGMNCSESNVGDVVAHERGVQQLDFGPGLVIPAGRSLFLQPSASTFASASAFGYKIPAEAAPTTAESVTGGEAPARMQ